MMKFIIHHYVIVMIFHIIYANLNNEDEGYIPASKAIVHGIIDKIDNIVKYVQSKATLENIDELLNNIEKKLMKAAKVLGTKGIKRVKLIMEGIKLKTLNITDSGRKSNDANINTNINNHSVSLEELSHNFEMLLKSKLDKLAIPNTKILAQDLKQKVLEFIKNNMNERISNDTRRVAEFISNKYSNEGAQQESAYKYQRIDENEPGSLDLLGVSSNPPKSQTANVDICHNVYSRICSDVKTLNNFKCRYDNVVVSLEKLCNGNIDCPDRSDEKLCNTHIVNKVEFAYHIIADVEASFENHCFDVDVKRSSLKKHTKILQDVLRAQLNFKEKYENFSVTTRPEDIDQVNEADNRMLKHSANELALIISSLSLALNGALCFHDNENIKTTDDIFESNVDKDMKDIAWPPKSCKCKKEFCLNCSDNCKKICWHKQSLSRWNCESISNTGSITMNEICDGKIDCFDETDEADCGAGTGYAKFKALEIYGNTVKIIQSKASKVQTSVRIKLLTLSNIIVKLQEISTKIDPDGALIKKLRNNCYTMLSTLYSDILGESHFVDESEDAYNFLLSINKNVASALKRSHTGNNRIIADGCYCRNGTCVVSYCPRSCVKACSVESKIIKYRCQNVNASVSVKDICDGKRNCPNGYDEQECQKEVICRRHHLIVLRHRLQDMGKKFKGTSLGELLQSWKTKVISTLKIAEKNSRPTPQVLRKIVKDVLRDLVLTYGSVEDYRRSNKEYALDDFIIIGQQVMNTLKSCGQ